MLPWWLIAGGIGVALAALFLKRNVVRRDPDDRMED